MTGKRRILSRVRPIFLLVVLAAVAVLVERNWSELTRRVPLFDWHLLVVAMSLVVLAHVCLSFVGTSVWSSIGVDVPLSHVVRVHFACLPARYLPGGVWHTVAKLTNFQDDLKLDKKRLFAYLVLENALSLAVAMMLGGCILLTYRFWPGLGTLLVALAVSIMALPWFLSLRRLPMREMLNASGLQRYVRIVMAQSCAWLAYSLAFASFWVGATGTYLDWVNLILIAGIYMVSWSAGFVALFAPQGLGISEVVAGLLLRGAGSNVGELLVLIGLFRLLALVSEGLAWLGSLLIFRFLR